MQSEAIIFVDTNFFLHYKQAKEIDWRSVVDADVVRLMVTTGTASELNEKKDFGKTKAIKKRAALALKLLEEVVDSDIPLEIRSQTFLDILPISFSDYSEHQLDPNCADDVLLLSALHYAQDHPSEAVYLLTADVGLRVKAKYRNIKHLKPDDSWKLQAEPDPEAKELQELRAQVHKMPKLAVNFASGDLFTTVVKAGPPQSDGSFVEQIVSRLRKRLPTHDPAFSPMLIPHEREVREYNRLVMGFYEEYRKFITEWLNVQQVLSRTVPIKLKVSNVGNAPASNPKIYADFETGAFELITLNAFLPTTPQLPPNLDSYLISQLGYQTYEHEPDDHQIESDLEKDNGVVRVEKNLVTFYNLPGLQHNSEAILTTVYARFDDFTKMDALKFEVSALADELSKSKLGSFNIQVKTTASQAHWDLPLLKDW